MKRTTLFILFTVSVSIIKAQVTPGSPDNFITVWNTQTTNSISIPTITSGSTNYDLYWEEIGNPTNNGNLLAQTTNVTISGLNTATNYRIEIAGSFPAIYIDNDPSEKDKLLEVSQWGTIDWTTMQMAFYGCTNLEITATDTPNLSNATNLFRMFDGCTSLTGVGANWNWNTSNVTNLGFMFNQVTNFNQNIGNWNTSSVQNMAYMFQLATSFNQNIGSWNTSNVVTMQSMFYGASSFNQDLNSWNTSNVTDMNNLFGACTNFNQNIGNWNTDNVTNMSGMFGGATNFNQNIGNWNTSNVTSMWHMFNAAASFNQDISTWNTMNVTNMEYMFYQASSFNQNIGAWNTGNVTNMSNMFNQASSFNQEIGSWDIGNVTNMSQMLSNSGLDCHNYSQTLIEWAANSTTPNYISLGALGRQFGSNAISSRDLLDNTKNWTFTGDAASGTDCSFAASIQENEMSLDLYPNPTSHQLTITPSIPTSAFITAANGAILSMLELHGETTVDVSTYAPGVYFIRTAEGQTVKFVKE